MQKEVRALCELRHPRLAELQAIFECREHTGERTAYLQLKHYANVDMMAWLSHATPSPLHQKWVLQQLAEGLQHLHAHDFAHGDVKMLNVLISEQVSESSGATTVLVKRAKAEAQR